MIITIYVLLINSNTLFLNIQGKRIKEKKGTKEEENKKKKKVEGVVAW
jgi:hypothetical protein